MIVSHSKYNGFRLIDGDGKEILNSKGKPLRISCADFPIEPNSVMRAVITMPIHEATLRDGVVVVHLID